MAWSLYGFATYLAVSALALLVAPAWVCWLLRLPPPDGLWVRLCAMFMSILAYYCYRSAREEEASFARWTLKTRPFVLVFVLGLVFVQLASPWLLLFGVIDILFTVWTRRHVV